MGAPELFRLKHAIQDLDHTASPILLKGTTVAKIQDLGLAVVVPSTTPVIHLQSGLVFQVPTEALEVYNPATPKKT